MPRRSFTSGRKFSTTHVGLRDQLLAAARTPSGSFRFSVIVRLLRCRFWKSGPSRGAAERFARRRSASGISILMTSAPQSASWRTQVGPARTRVRSSTVKRDSAFEAGLWDMGGDFLNVNGVVRRFYHARRRHA